MKLLPVPPSERLEDGTPAFSHRDIDTAEALGLLRKFAGFHLSDDGELGQWARVAAHFVGFEGK